MAWWSRKPGVVDAIGSDALADFGRFEFLGEQSGVRDPYGLVSALVPRCIPPDGPDAAEVVAELRRHAARGEWEKVGAWKFVREFLAPESGADDLVDAGLLAIHRMRVTNLAIHLAPIDTPRFTELTGGPPPHDGFFGPPVFDSGFGPTRQYYFDAAVAAAAGRRIGRVPSAPGVPPGPVDEAARAMWDFGLLVHRGPLLVSPDISFEPGVVRPAVAAATGVDHALFVERLAEAVLDDRAVHHGVWSSLGAARFVEDYLDLGALRTAGYELLLERAIVLVAESGILGVAMPADVMTRRQRERLHAARPPS
ncbi:hypothetical protein ACI78T_06735 [Blastococcus sp. SYSU D00922]